MRTLTIALIAVSTMATSAMAQTAPNLKGTWSGKWKTVIYGHNPHHPPETPADAARVREIVFTLEVEGQDGRVLWGKSWSNPDRKEPFAATIAADGRTIIGADTDGSLTMRIGGRGRLDACYAHPAIGPSKSIVASCGALQRAK